MIDTSAANVNSTHRQMIAAADQRLASAASGSSLAAAAVAAAAAHAAHSANAAAAAAAVGSNNADHGTTMSAAQKNPFAIQELLGLTSHGDQIKASSNGGTASSTNNPGNNPSSTPTGNSVSGMGATFPPISCYNSSFFNSSAVDQYNQHQRMYFNSAGLFGNLHHQSQSFATSTAAASHLLDSTLRSDHSLSSKENIFSSIFRVFLIGFFISY